MRILRRYVLIETAKVFSIALVGLTLMMILVGVVREAAAQNLPMGQVLRLIPYILPDALRVAVPVTLLLAATSVFGRLAGSNEIVAAKALGISPWAVLWPTYVAAFFLSLITVGLNDLAVSWGRDGFQRVVVGAIEEIVYGMLESRHSYSSPNFSINVTGVEDRRLIRPIISLKTGGNRDTFITARHAEIRADHSAGVLRIMLFDAKVDSEDQPTTLSHPGVFEQVIDLSAATRRKQASGHPSTLPLRVISDELDQQKALIDQDEHEQAIRAASQLLTGDFDGLIDPEWETRAKVSENMRSRLYRLRTEPHRRWSAGFSCLCFVWVGAPMAIRLRRSDFLTSFFACFLPILIIYYPVMMGTIDLSKGGFSPLCLWVGNGLLLVWGAWLLRRVIRY